MPPQTKPNPRKAELKEALAKATTKDGEIPGILKAAASAMEGKAWTGGTSDVFATGLTEETATAKKGGTASVAEIQSAYDNCPDTVADPTADDTPSGGQ